MGYIDVLKEFLIFMILTPFKFILWIIIICPVFWVMGFPITVNVGDNRRTYRWFTRIK